MPTSTSFWIADLADARARRCNRGAPYFGDYMPERNAPVRDFHTLTIVYTNPIEASDRFFRELKPILRQAPLIPQDEMLIERSEVFLV